MKKPIIIIPAYNPDKKLISLVENLKKTNQQLIVVNDGSNPEYSYIFETLKDKFMCEICVHSRNMGKGAALKTGIQYAAKNYPESCGYVTADADGQHAPTDILNVSNLLEKNPNHLILGTRDFSNKTIPFKSKWGNQITSWVFLLSTGKRCADTQTGLRGIPKKYLDTCLSVSGNKYEYEMNLLIELTHKKISFSSVPIATIYLDNNSSSHFHPVRDSILIYFNIFKYSLSSLASTIIDLSIFSLFINVITGTGTAGILAATVTARLVSGNMNFFINKHWVFQSKNKNTQEGVKYFSLFFVQMMLSWLFVTSLSYLPVSIIFVKILVDTTLFFLSYQIQKRYIFKTKKARSVNCR